MGKLAGWAASVAAQLALLPSAGRAPRKDAERGVAQPRCSVPPESLEGGLKLRVDVVGWAGGKL